MEVKLLIGRLAGEIVDLPFVEAQNMLDNGTAAEPDDHTVRVRGVDTGRGESVVEEVKTVEPVYQTITFTMFSDHETMPDGAYVTGGWPATTKCTTEFLKTDPYVTFDIAQRLVTIDVKNGTAKYECSHPDDSDFLVCELLACTYCDLGRMDLVPGLEDEGKPQVAAPEEKPAPTVDPVDDGEITAGNGPHVADAVAEEIITGYDKVKTHHMTKIKWAKIISGGDVANEADADKIIEAFLEEKTS